MSLSTALTSALSGLNASSREAELVANNIANALTPGYTARTVELGAATVGGTGSGVRVAGVTLLEDPAAVSARRRSDAELGARDVATKGLDAILAALGVPGTGSALADKAASFENALLAAANDPASDPRLAEAVAAADSYAGAIATLSTETQTARMAADAEIAKQVALVNDNLQSIEVLNREIRLRSYAGGDASALIDTRKALIDEISSVLPIRAVNREDGSVALFTENGATLIDGPAGELGFTATPLITQDMTRASGALSGLTLNGRPLSVGDPDGGGMADGGTLGALFLQRDTVLPGFANQLDALAEDLVLRFQDAGLDGTRAAGDPGLFTDGGAAYDPANREGLAGRLAINAEVDPLAGGAAYRLRDGLGATAPGDVGEGALLAALHGAATAALPPDAALGFTGAGGLSDFAAGLTSAVAARQQQAETVAGYTAALNATLREAELSVSGVNTDREMQRMLLVERSYAANAFVLSTIDDMIRRLMEI